MTRSAVFRFFTSRFALISILAWVVWAPAISFAQAPASGAGEKVPDHSRFKTCFLDFIEGRDQEPFKDGYITGEELGYFLKHKAPDYIKWQHPQYGKINDPKLDKGDFVFERGRIVEEAPERTEEKGSTTTDTKDAKDKMDTMDKMDANAANASNTANAAKQAPPAASSGQPSMSSIPSISSIPPGARQTMWAAWKPITPTPPPSPSPAYVKKSADGRFLVSQEGVILDTITNLEWLVGPDKDANYTDADQWVNSQTVAGGGWRMPTREELKGIFWEESWMAQERERGIGYNAGDSYNPGYGAYQMFGFKTWKWVWAEPKDSSSAWCVLFGRHDLVLTDDRAYSDSSWVYAVRSRR